MRWARAIACPVCGEAWQPYAGTRLRGHARCVGGPELRADLLAVKDRFPRVTQARLARDLGVSVAVLRLWLRMGLAEAKRAGRGPGLRGPRM